MLACIGFDLGPVHAYATDLLYQTAFTCDCQHLDKQFAERPLVNPAECADRIVVGMGVRGDVTDRHVAVGGFFYAPRSKTSGGVAENQQRAQHRRRILFAAAASVIDLERRNIQLFHQVHNESGDVVLRKPIPKIRGQQHRRPSVYIDEASSHAVNIKLVKYSSSPKPWKTGKCSDREQPITSDLGGMAFRSSLSYARHAA